MLHIDAEIKETALRITRAMKQTNIHCMDNGHAQRENQSMLNINHYQDKISWSTDQNFPHWQSNIKETNI